MKAKKFRIAREELESFCRLVFQKCGLAEEEALTTADVLVSADACGIPSHGVARLRRYVNGLQSGLMGTEKKEQIITETPTSLVIDAHGTMGAPVSARAMKMVIEKARKAGAGFCCVQNSNHFGMAGYYAKMALDEDMLGIAMTNTAALGVPTFGRMMMYGTNPLAFAAPADTEHAFVLDMSTTVVTRGKVETYEREESPLPEGWVVNKHGRPNTDPGAAIEEIQNREGGGILPLGGFGKLYGGHKGYGLAVMVDILCAVLGGAQFGQHIFDTPDSSARVSHFFGAINIGTFRDPGDFRRDMDRMLQELRETPVAEGEQQVYYAGLPEFEAEERNNADGIPLSEKVYVGLVAVAEEFRLPPPVATERSE